MTAIEYSFIHDFTVIELLFRIKLNNNGNDKLEIKNVYQRVC